MKAIAVKPGVPNSIHLTEIPQPAVEDIANGRGVLVRVLRVGVDGTDKEINAAEYGQAPNGFDYLGLVTRVLDELRKLDQTSLKSGRVIMSSQQFDVPARASTTLSAPTT